LAVLAILALVVLFVVLVALAAPPLNQAFNLVLVCSSSLSVNAYDDEEAASATFFTFVGGSGFF